MSSEPLRAADLRERIADPHRAPACASCAGLARAGWESIGSPVDATRLERLGTLRPVGDDEPTLQEHHPAGTRYWSVDAPIAVEFFPYNRCDVWQCAACGRPFLRYTEYGGYYQESRIRALAPELVSDAAPE